jgi:hypothetical protein
MFSQEYYSEGNRIERLTNILNQLTNEHQISLPSSKKLWDYSYHPPVPQWIRIMKIRPKKINQPWKKYPWHPRLIWASQLKNLQTKGFMHLTRLNDFFIQLGNKALKLMSIKERSIQIFGNEKELDALLKRSWFHAHISLPDLGCYQTYEPFASKTFSSTRSQRTIIIENRDTFDSFCKINQRQEIPNYRYIIYGCGEKIQNTVLWINDFDAQIQTLEYFGDLDVEGLFIPYRANQILIENKYKQHIELAQNFYIRLIEIARKHFAESYSTLKDEILNQGYELLNFLSSEDHAFIISILKQKHRIAQELLNIEEISNVFKEDIISKKNQ